MKRLDLDEILNREPGKLTEPHYEYKKLKVKIKQSDISCESGKVSYPTAQDAENAVKLMKKKHRGSKWYKCEFCGQYHLTSLKAKRKGKMRV